VAHKGKLAPPADCWRYVDAIGAQLKAWDVID